MTHSTRADPEQTSPDLPILRGRTSVAMSWGELSFDQADGFAPVYDPDLPGPDVNDDRGYGFGV